jgi:hypothetical protein
MNDFNLFLIEIGMTAEQVRTISEDFRTQTAGHYSGDFSVKDSNIEGLGVFAERSFKAGDIIGLARVSGKRAVLGRYVNHSSAPNAQLTQQGEDLVTVALRDIKAGEEITNDYRVGAKLNGFLPAPSIMRVKELESALLRLPQVDLKTTHVLSGGVYARTIFIPAGVTLTGAAHRKAHVNIMNGDITVSTNEGMKRLIGHHIFAAEAGHKRVGHAHADTVWTSLFQTSLVDIEEIENEIVFEPETLQTRTLSLAAPQVSLLEVA